MPREVPFGARVLQVVGLCEHLCVLTLSMCMLPCLLFAFKCVQVRIAVHGKIPYFHFFCTCYVRFILL